MDMGNLSLGYWMDDSTRLSGTVYYRQNKTSTLNGDVNDDFEGDAALDGDAGAGVAGAGVNRDTAANNRSQTKQKSWGGAVQWSRQSEINQLAVGATLDKSKTAFGQTTELGIFDASRGVINGTGEVQGPRLSGETRSWSVFVADTFKPATDIAITGAMRYNHSRVIAVDGNRATPTLDGDFTYKKLNPSLGITWAAFPAVSVYASAGQGNRAPSPIELGCADPANPCSLPNAMQADPFLKQVVTQTFEAGARGQSGSLNWNATVYTATNKDDILFVGTGGSQGYFTNFGRTRRQGFELGFAQSLGAVKLRASYNYVKATYQSSACVLAEANSTRGQGCAANDEVLIQAGNRMPNIPLHSMKIGADVAVSQDWAVTADLMSYSSQYVRGNENNAHQAGTTGGRTFLGSGEAKGYSLLNLGTRVKLDRKWELFARVNNVLDKKYASAGALGENPFNAAGTFQTNSDDWTRETFYGPGAPRSAFVGVRLSM